MTKKQQKKQEMHHKVAQQPYHVCKLLDVLCKLKGCGFDAISFK